MVGTVGTGTAPGGATLLAAAPVDSLALNECYAVYKFGQRLASISALAWGPCAFNCNIGPFFASDVRFAVHAISANFNTADGQPTPASVGLLGQDTRLTFAAPAAPVISPCSYASGLLPGPFWGVMVIPTELIGGGRSVANAFIPPFFNRWLLTVYGVLG